MAITVALASGGGVGALATWLSARSKQPAEYLTAQAAFQQALNETATAFQAAQARLIDHQNAELRDMREGFAAVSRKTEECEGRERQQAQRWNSLLAHLRREGIDIPDSFAAIDTPKPEPVDGVTMFQPTKRRVK